MQKTMLLFFIGAIAFSIPCSGKKKQVPLAPLPTAIVKAHKIFITNAGGSQLAFDEFYSQLKQWGQFQIVGSPGDADLIMELRFAVEDHGPKFYSSYNSYTKQTSVHSSELIDPQLTMDIYDPSSKQLIWSDIDHTRLARFQSNRDKETVKSADRIVAQLQERIALPQ
jgi:hypothetical protein